MPPSPDHDTAGGAPPFWLDRLVAGLVLVLAVYFTVILAMVSPDPRGFGTHELLGMEPCSWPAHGDVPCPTCGVTTAATHLVHLQPVAAVRTHPFGAALAALGWFLAGLALVSLFRNRPYLERLVRLPYGTAFIALVLLLLGSWLYKYLTFAA